MKTILKLIEVIFWLPFVFVGIIAKLIFQGFIGGWLLVNNIHKWMDGKIKFSDLLDEDEAISRR